MPAIALSGIRRASADQVDDFGLDDPTCLASSLFLHRETGTIAALPVQQQLDFLTLDVRNYLVQHDTDDVTLPTCPKSQALSQSS